MFSKYVLFKKGHLNKRAGVWTPPGSATEVVPFFLPRGAEGFLCQRECASKTIGSSAFAGHSVVTNAPTDYATTIVAVARL